MTYIMRREQAEELLTILRILKSGIEHWAPLEHVYTARYERIISRVKVDLTRRSGSILVEIDQLILSDLREFLECLVDQAMIRDDLELRSLLQSLYKVIAS